MLLLETKSGSLTIGMIVCDLDRTLTNERLHAVPAALEEFRRARRHGVRTVLATGRTKREIARRKNLLSAFDDVVLEGGGLIAPASAIAPGGHVQLPDHQQLRRFDALAQWLSQQGVEHARGVACLSVDRRDEALVRAFPGSDAFAFHVNYDRLDLTLLGVDKGIGLRRLLDERPSVGASLAFGDGLNDIPLLEAAEYGVAVSNADPKLKRRADEVTDEYGGRGVATFLATRLKRLEEQWTQLP